MNNRPFTDKENNPKPESFIYNASKDIAPLGSWNLWTKMYISENDPLNPLLSPLFGNYKGIPPLFICVVTHEIHLDDCVQVAKTAQTHGVDVTLKQWDKMVHAFPLLAPLFPEAKQALDEICYFTKNHLLA
ncbi:MAG: alpha/beta hydrolase fold domain-containing protein [Bacteroidales bacterium]|nr:alpha/beta hydrolase fold domain-containing protein [Bacteroidales bacterium]